MKAVVETKIAKLLDVIALVGDQPALNLASGQVGTIVETLAPDVFEVEFCDREGQASCFAELRRNDFLVIPYEADVTR